MEIRERLLQAALQVFEETGSRGATTRRIASEAGVNEITLFRHFGSKEALLLAALETAARRSLVSELPEQPADPAGELTAWCREHYRHLCRNRALIRTSMGEFEENPHVSSSMCEGPKQIATELRNYLLRLRTAGLASPDFDTDAASAMLMGSLFSDAMSREIMPERYPYSADEAPAKYVELFLRAIGAGADRGLAGTGAPGVEA